MRMDWYGQKWERTQMFGRINVGLWNPPLWTGDWFSVKHLIAGLPTTESKVGGSTRSKTKGNAKTSTSCSKQKTTALNSQNGAKRLSGGKNGSL